ncbi:MAG TPA: histidine phosphatase family protein [Xanthobacteraceae bacterium]|jgi:probable phosphoglycerate mutase|nr:histidine phosphatase family protein [Xanthobacteraceae bacterium]
MPHPLLYFIRHGETDWNIEGRLQGQSDTPLNARGRKQAVACGKILAGVFAREGRNPNEPDYVASPLSRARETMELVRSTLGLAPDHFHLDPALMELSFGRWEGSTIPELRVIDAQGIVERERDKWNFVPPGGESYEQLTQRVATWLKTATRDTVVLAHGGTMRALVTLLEIAPKRTAPVMPIDQGVVYCLSEGRLERYE